MGNFFFLMDVEKSIFFKRDLHIISFPILSLEMDQINLLVENLKISAGDQADAARARARERETMEALISREGAPVDKKLVQDLRAEYPLKDDNDEREKKRESIRERKGRE